jgi:hypothetical protein
MIEDPNNFGIMTTHEEEQHRRSLCNLCEKKTLMNDIETCHMCACPIDYVTTYKFKICPLNKWGIE